MRVRSLMIPPGIPDFLTRVRLLQAGPVTLRGRAWVGGSSISRVEVSADGGSTWADARLEEGLSPHAWWGWAFNWEAKHGKHTLCVRATDAQGNVQPTEQAWNYQGMGNNIAHRVDVIVE